VHVDLVWNDHLACAAAALDGANEGDAADPLADPIVGAKQIDLKLLGQLAATLS
jgi:hypothetical protein